MKSATSKLKNIQWRIGLPERKKSADYPEPSASGFRCHVCHDLKEAFLPLEFDYDALGSSSSSCAACAFLQTVLQPHANKTYHLGPSVSPGRHQDPITISIDRTDCDLRVRLDRPTYRDSIVLHVCALEGSQQPSHTIPYGIPRKVDRSKRVAKFKIQEWLAECASSHDHCRRSTSKTPCLPTRVLEIRGPREVRLLQTASQETAVTLPYACLSHCWGGQVPIQLMKDNLQQFLNEDIAWDAFPQTFQDAIDLTHRLGLRYLWIDSLCIIQDDLSDWRKEGSKMADIYSGSYITLAALGANNSNQGFYQDWESFGFHEENHTIGQDDASAPQCPVVVFTEPWKYLYRSIPLHYRAWFLQERLLSPRVVHFAHNLAYWECLESSVCQTEGVASLTFDKARFYAQMDTLAAEHILSSPRDWHEIVRMYSRGGLTYAKDKLPALQAIARMVQNKRKCAYYAGLWEDSLIFDLIWKSRLWLGVRRRKEWQPPEYVAPSWSWASNDSAVMYEADEDCFEVAATVVSAQTTPVGDPLGQVTAGSISLKGYCLPATIKGERYDCSDIVLDCSQELQEMWYPDYHESEGDREVLLIYLGTTTNETSGGHAYCLVLAKVGSKRSDFFRRVGSKESSFFRKLDSKESSFFRRVGLYETSDPQKWVMELFKRDGEVKKVVIL